MRTAALILLFVFLGIAGCRFGDKGSYTPSDPQVKSRTDFRPGSYWIMQDSATGQVDSFFVTNYLDTIHYSVEDRSNELIIVQIKETALSSSTTDTTNWFVRVGQLGNPQEISVGSMLQDDSTLVMQLTNIYAPVYALAALTVNGRTYSNVYMTTGSGYLPQLGQYLIVAIQGNNGFAYISMNYRTYHHTWFLLRANVVHS
jgi:hypothetical protein